MCCVDKDRVPFVLHLRQATKGGLMARGLACTFNNINEVVEHLAAAGLAIRPLTPELSEEQQPHETAIADMVAAFLSGTMPTQGVCDMIAASLLTRLFKQYTSPQQKGPKETNDQKQSRRSRSNNGRAYEPNPSSRIHPCFWKST